MKIRIVALAALGALACTQALAAGTVEVNFIKPETYTDAGFGIVERERNLDILARHMKSLGARVPNGQALTIEVIDVDLAGETHVSMRWPDLRILRGTVDWPRIKLRWTLTEGGRTLRSGEDRLSDTAYLTHTTRLGDTRALVYELRMLDDWFGRRVVVASK